MEIADELSLRCADPELQGYERFLRRTLFQWKHFPVDMCRRTVHPGAQGIHNSGFGVTVHEHTAVTRPHQRGGGAPVRQPVRDEDDLARIRVRDRTTPAESAVDRRWRARLFERAPGDPPLGADPYLSLWDPSAPGWEWRTPSTRLADTPEFMHKLVGRVT